MSGNPSDRDSLEGNPYAAPQATDSDATDVDISDAEAIRRAHLDREASIQSVGPLYLYGALILVLGSILQAVQIEDWEGSLTSNSPLISCGFALSVGVALGLLCWGCDRLCGWARPMGIVLHLLCIPLSGLLYRLSNDTVLISMFVICGLLMNVYVLWLLSGEKGRFVFSPEYRAVREATPQIRYKAFGLFNIWR